MLSQQGEECGDAAAAAIGGCCDEESGGRTQQLWNEMEALPEIAADYVLRCDGVLATCDGAMVGGGERVKHVTGVMHPFRCGVLGPCHDRMGGLGALERPAYVHDGDSAAPPSKTLAAVKASVVA